MEQRRRFWKLSCKQKRRVLNAYIFMRLQDDGTFQSGPQRTASLNEAGRNARDSPHRRNLANKQSGKTRRADDQWFVKLEAEARNGYDDDDEQMHAANSLAKATRGRSSTKRKKKRPDQMQPGLQSYNKNFDKHQLELFLDSSELGSPTSNTALNGKSGGGGSSVYSSHTIQTSNKKGCCCTIL